ncbi:MAG TPA: zinc-binding dehydrogenase [Solirubrobacteraceae bacterium]|nr:zinc-binding dehydrogenase [Solirubrobacteraceae bacterium]
MRAVVCTQARLEAVDGPPPVPGKGQVRIEVLRCGICGSDLHAREHCDELADVLGEAGYDGFMRADQRVVFGHEFCGVVAEHGPGCQRKIPAGTHVVALPLLRTPGGFQAVGLSATAPGGYAEQMLVQESLMLPVPNGLAPDVSVLTEPMAVAWHAVRRSEVRKRDVAIVIGCGPIGLAVICMLKARGVRTIVASDPSPGRRALAQACGAHVTVDPGESSPFAAAGDRGHLETIPAAAQLAVGTVEKLRRLPIAWHRVWRGIDAVGIKPAAPVVFECVGIPGIIEQILTSAPLFSRVVVVGVCMGEDRFRPSMAINKEIELRFVIGYNPLEFHDTLQMLAEGKVDPGPLLTGIVGLEGVGAAFAELGSPDLHAKILIDPSSDAQGVELVGADRQRQAAVV